VAIKLFNRSGLPDEPLRALLTSAAQLVGAKGDTL
jgi:hypothetical protein